MLMTALLIVCAVLLDRLLGEPRRWHPLVGFGHYASWLERTLNRGGVLRLRGVLAWVLALAPVILLVAFLWLQPLLRPIVGALTLYFALGMQSLREHAERIQQALQEGDLEVARRRRVSAGERQ